MKNKKPKQDDWKDDGRVIADMNVDGMRGGFFSPRRPHRARRDPFGQPSPPRESVQLSRTERRAIARGVFTAYAAAGAAVIALMTLVFFLLSRLWAA